MAIILPSSTNPVAPQTPVAPASIAVAESAPPKFFEQEIGTVIDAEVLHSPGPSSFKVQTSLGKLLLLSGLKVTQGEKLQLQLQKLTPQLKFLVRTEISEQNQGKNHSTMNTANSTSDNIAGIANSTTSRSKNLEQNLQAVQKNSYSAGNAQTTPANGLKYLDMVTAIKATILQITTTPKYYYNHQLSDTSRATSENGATLNNPQAGVARPGTNKTSDLPSGTSQRSSRTSLALGSVFEVRISSYMLDNSYQSATSLTQGIVPGQKLHANVIDTNAAGQPIVETSFGQLILDTTAQIPLDTGLLIEVISSPETISSAHSIGNPVAPLYAARDWPALNDALYIIQGSDVASRQLFANIPIPKIDSQLTSNILFFISALRGGNISNWLGSEACSLLQISRPNLFNQLNEEFNQMARSFNEATTNDWRNTLIPFFNGSQFEYFQMHLRGGSKNNQKNANENSARFIVDVELSNLGRIQLDGLVKSKGREFDLYVRSEQQFAKSLRRDINKIFIDFTEVTGISGKIVLQAGHQFVNIPISDMAQRQAPGIVV